MTMFKRSKGTNRGAATGGGGAISWPPAMPDSVYQRNGIAMRPAAPAQLPAGGREYDLHYRHEHTRPADPYRSHYNGGAATHNQHYSRRDDPYAYANPSGVRVVEGEHNAVSNYVHHRPPRPDPRRTDHRAQQSRRQPHANHSSVPYSPPAEAAPSYAPPRSYHASGSGDIAQRNVSTSLNLPATERRHYDGAASDLAVGPALPSPPAPQHVSDISGSSNENAPTTSSSDNNEATRRLSGPRRFLPNICKSIKRNSKKKNAKGKTMRIYVQSGMEPGQIIRTLCPDQTIKDATIPPASSWVTELVGNGSQQLFFRVQFDPSAATLVPTVSASARTTPGTNQTNQQNAQRTCNCVPRLGVFDSMCSEHGPPRPPSLSNHYAPPPTPPDISNHSSNNNQRSSGSGEQNVQQQQQDDMSDMISVAQDDRVGGGSFVSYQPSVTEKGWRCRACGLVNDLESDACDVCALMRDGSGEFGAREREMQPSTLVLR